MDIDGVDAAVIILYKVGRHDMGSDSQRLAIRYVHPFLDPIKLFQAGLTCHNSELLHGIMTVMRCKIVSGVRRKARVRVPKALNAIGVLDETEILRPGEIFIQYTHPWTGSVVPVTGKVIIGRAPCMHPGDLQSVTAVDYPGLRHLVNVVVFPSCGKRPLPNMLSGGDLDGDIFSVIWDERVTNNCKVVEPMLRTRRKAKPLNRPVTVDDVMDFFVRYMREDNLGFIGNAHLVHADREEKGIFSDTALQLAELYSIAVDFAKTGVPAQLPRKLKVTPKVEQYPDFMMKDNSVSYPSKYALGRMFRACPGGLEYCRTPAFSRNGSALSMYRIFNRVRYDNPDLDTEAEESCEQWNEQVRRLIRAFGINEAELVCGQVIQFESLDAQCHGSMGDAYYAEIQKLNRYMDELRKAFRGKLYCDVVRGTNGNLSRSEVHKMSPWVKASNCIALLDKKANKKAILSFPFAVADVYRKMVGQCSIESDFKDRGSPASVRATLRSRTRQ